LELRDVVVDHGIKILSTGNGQGADRLLDFDRPQFTAANAVPA